MVSLLIAGVGFGFTSRGPGIPVTGLAANDVSQTGAPAVTVPAPVETFDAFYARVVDGTPQVRGVYAEGLFALDIVQQTYGGAGYVDSNFGTVTQFEYASYFDVIGLLAHNYLSGSDFFKLTLGTHIQVIYGTGEVKTYVVDNVQHYQAISSQDSRSPLVDLATGAVLDASAVFQRHYMGTHKVTFQTCIANHGDPYWGRAFISASPLVVPTGVAPAGAAN